MPMSEIPFGTADWPGASQASAIPACSISGAYDLSGHPFEPLIRLAEGGDADARRQLFTSLYKELHGIARRELRRCGGALTLGATTLLHEARDA